MGTCKANGPVTRERFLVVGSKGFEVAYLKTLRTFEPYMSPRQSVSHNNNTDLEHGGSWVRIPSVSSYGRFFSSPCIFLYNNNY